MLYEKIFLYADNPGVYLEVFVADSVCGERCRAMVVFPGGGYTEICHVREGEPVALAFMPHGFNAFVLHYSVGAGENVYPKQLREVALAMKHIKDNADKYNINPDEVFTVGFSAGGHLAASSGVFWKREEVISGIDMPYGYNKPKGVIPVYPVINYEGHRYSINMLLGETDSDQEKLNYVSVDQHVDSDSAPAFMMHTVGDADVDVRNTLSLAMAYANAKIPFEMHIYPDGPHGMALANSITAAGNPAFNDPIVAEWVRLAAAWADRLCKK